MKKLTPWFVISGNWQIKTKKKSVVNVANEEKKLNIYGFDGI